MNVSLIPYKRNTSGHRGVTWNRANGVWVATIVVKKKRYHLGCFQNVDDAALAYKRAFEAHYGKGHRPPKQSGKKRTPSEVRLEVAAAYTGDDCLIWQYVRDTHGYARVTVDGRTGNASRRICELVNGPAPTDRHQAAHSCGNGHLGCVNPRHLSWKTPVENNADKKQHGTYQIGEKNSQARLTSGQVVEIRELAASLSQGEIARRFGVSHSTVGDIVHRKRWAHI